MSNGDGSKTGELKGVEPSKGLDLPKSQVSSRVLSGAEHILDGNYHYGVAVQVTSSGADSTLMIPDAGAVKDGKPLYITKPIRISGRNLKDFLKHKNIELPKELRGFMESTSISCEAFYYTKKPGPLLIMFALKFEPLVFETKKIEGLEEHEWEDIHQDRKTEIMKSCEKLVDPPDPITDEKVLFEKLKEAGLTGLTEQEKSFIADKTRTTGGGLIQALTGDPSLGQLFDITGASVRILRCESPEKNPEDFKVLQKYAAELSS